LKSKPTAEKGQQALEPNHTHFLLLDDGTYYGYDTGDYRTRFVTEISEYKNKDSNSIVCFLFDIRLNLFCF